MKHKTQFQANIENDTQVGSTITCGPFLRGVVKAVGLVEVHWEGYDFPMLMVTGSDEASVMATLRIVQDSLQFPEGVQAFIACADSYTRSERYQEAKTQRLIAMVFPVE